MMPWAVPSDSSLVPQACGNGLPAPHTPELSLISAHDRSPATPATQGPDCQKLKPNPAPIRPPRIRYVPSPLQSGQGPQSRQGGGVKQPFGGIFSGFTPGACAGQQVPKA